jgi:hypothetical protein
MIAMSVSDVVAVATVMRFNRSGGRGSWPVIDKRAGQRAYLPATAFAAHPSRRIAE